MSLWKFLLQSTKGLFPLGTQHCFKPILEGSKVIIMVEVEWTTFTKVFIVFCVPIFLTAVLGKWFNFVP